MHSLYKRDSLAMNQWLDVFGDKVKLFIKVTNEVSDNFNQYKEVF